MAKVTIRQKKSIDGAIMTGATTEVLVDGKPVPGLTAISFEVAAKGVAKVKMEMVGDFELEGNFILGKLDRQIKKEVDNERKES